MQIYGQPLVPAAVSLLITILFWGEVSLYNPDRELFSIVYSRGICLCFTSEALPLVGSGNC